MTDGEASRLRAAGILALSVLAVLLVSGRSNDLLGSPARLALLLVVIGASAAFWWTVRLEIVVAAVVAVGLVLRWVDMPPGGAGGSDVAAAINEAIGVWLGGGNPYDHTYTQTRPPGQPMPYPPGALLVHLPGHLVSGLAGVQWTQFAFSAAAMALLAWVAAMTSWMAGLGALALYAAAPNLVNLANDGSNDTVTGALLLLAIVAAWRVLSDTARSGQPAADGDGTQLVPDRSGLVLAGLAAALALSTKQIALPIVLALTVLVVRAVGWRASMPYLGAGVGLGALISVPFLVMGPIEYVTGLFSALGVHEDVYGWNIWALGQGFGIPPWDRDTVLILSLGVAAVALVGVALLPMRTVAGATLAGVVATVAILFAARWTTYAYFALLLPPLLIIPALTVGATKPGPRKVPE